MLLFVKCEVHHCDFLQFLVHFYLGLQFEILIAINRAIKIFNRDYSQQNKKHKFVAQNNSIIHDITSNVWCKSQQNVLNTEI